MEAYIKEITLLLDALHFAADKHRFKSRKDPESTPYINHVIAVTEILARVGGVTDMVTLQAAVLHDTVEDTTTTPAELEDRFGAEVCGVVMEVTDDKSLDKDVRKELQIKHAPHLSDRAKVVKVADKICNVLDVTHHPATDWDLERRREYLDWAEKVAAGCAGVNAAMDDHLAEVLAQGWAELGGRPR